MRKGESLDASGLRERVAVVGVGNILMADEAIGVEIVNALAKQPLPPNVETFDAGTAFDQIAYELAHFDRVIIVDAVRGGGEPGSVYRFRPEDVESPDCSGSACMSLHQMGVLESLRLLKLTGTELPTVTILGVEPARIEFADGLSDRLRRQMPAVIQALRDEIARVSATVSGRDGEIHS
jgi:hydrogenase maturation protease